MRAARNRPCSRATCFGCTWLRRTSQLERPRCSGHRIRSGRLQGRHGGRKDAAAPPSGGYDGPAENWGGGCAPVQQVPVTGSASLASAAGVLVAPEAEDVGDRGSTQRSCGSTCSLACRPGRPVWTPPIRRCDLAPPSTGVVVVSCRTRNRSCRTRTRRGDADPARAAAGRCPGDRRRRRPRTPVVSQVRTVDRLERVRRCNFPGSVAAAGSSTRPTTSTRCWTATSTRCWTRSPRQTARGWPPARPGGRERQSRCGRRYVSATATLDAGRRAEYRLDAGGTGRASARAFPAPSSGSAPLLQIVLGRGLPGRWWAAARSAFRGAVVEGPSSPARPGRCRSRGLHSAARNRTLVNWALKAITDVGRGKSSVLRPPSGLESFAQVTGRGCGPPPRGARWTPARRWRRRAGRGSRS